MARHLYLDIDGVLNPWHIDGTWGRVVEKTIFTHYAPALVDAMNELIAEVPNLKVFWLTSWEESAHDYGEDAGLIGGAHWPWLPASSSGREEDWQKFISIQAHLEQAQPERAVWCDDELLHERTAWEWASARSDVLAISPENVLTPEHLEQIRTFLMA